MLVEEENLDVSTRRDCVVGESWVVRSLVKMYEMELNGECDEHEADNADEHDQGMVGLAVATSLRWTGTELVLSADI